MWRALPKVIQFETQPAYKHPQLVTYGENGNT